jgi:hypothetical protein
MGPHSMSSIQRRSSCSARDITFRRDATSGMSRSALISYERAPSADGDIWNRAIDELLDWMSQACAALDDDQPSKGALEAAIDFAQDQVAAGGPAPDSIVPSASGNIVMEWNDRGTIVLVRFVDVGEARMTRLEKGRVVFTGSLCRDPRSRSIQLRST